MDRYTIIRDDLTTFFDLLCKQPKTHFLTYSFINRTYYTFDLLCTLR